MFSSVIRKTFKQPVPRRTLVQSRFYAKFFTKDHEYCEPEGDLIKVGISDFAQEKLGDIVFVDLPQKDATVTKGQSFATVESVKAASDVYAPISGTVAAINPALADSPDLLNNDPYTEGWMIKVKASDFAADSKDLMDEEEYAMYCAEQH